MPIFEITAHSVVKEVYQIAADTEEEACGLLYDHPFNPVYTTELEFEIIDVEEK